MHRYYDSLYYRVIHTTDVHIWGAKKLVNLRGKKKFMHEASKIFMCIYKRVQTSVQK